MKIIHLTLLSLICSLSLCFGQAASDAAIAPEAVNQNQSDEAPVPSGKNGSAEASEAVLSTPSETVTAPGASAEEQQAATAVTQETAVDTTSKKQESASAVVEESEEELILDGGEESLIPAAGASTPQTTQSSDSSSATQTSASAQQGGGDVNGPADSLSTAQKAANVINYPVSPIPAIPEEPAKPAIIEQTRSINFAKNYSEYRSPKMAFLLSLLVPGVGQAYAHKKIKTGIFGAVEVGLITAGSIVGVKGSRKWDDARDFANDHWHIDTFMTYYNTLEQNNENAIEEIFEGSYVSVDTFQMEAHNRSQEFYNYIKYKDSPFIQGWDDVNPRFDENFEIINRDNSVVFYKNADSAYLVFYVDDNGDTSRAYYGFSKYQDEYNKLRSRSNQLFGTSKTLFTLLIINHLASAFDAMITAKAFNDALLGKTSLWQRFNIREATVSTPCGVANGLALEVRF